MFKLLDPFINLKCPHCHNSLRFRFVTKKHEHNNSNLVTPYHCPICNELIIETIHPAFANNWLWSRFYLPGVFLCMIGIFIPSISWILPIAVIVLIAGFILLVGYMIKERLGWQVYKPYDHDI